MKDKQNRSFCPDVIATSLHQALNRDLSSTHKSTLNTRSPLAYGMQVQCDTFLKKYVSPSLDQDPLVADAHLAFLNANEHMRRKNIMLWKTLPEQYARIQRRTSVMDRIHIRARHLLETVLGKTFMMEDWFRECKHSQGTSIGVKFSNTSLEAKWTFPITMTSEVKPLFESYLAWDSSLAAAVENYNSEHPISGAVKIVQGSRAATVDKTESSRRFINIEATADMFFEQGLMRMMYKRMAKFGIDVTTLPDEHKCRAWAASLTGHEATIDMRQASDMCSKTLVLWQMPAMWGCMINVLRAKSIEIDKTRYNINMVSAMGNATTFPIETLIFWTYGQAVLYESIDPLSNTKLFPADFPYKNVSVFGDDCIVPTAIAPHFIKVMATVGFIVNDEKSFYEPTTHNNGVPFRESCGGDYLLGHNVRPFNLKAPLSTRRSSLGPWLNITFNRLLSKYRMYFGSLKYVYNRALFQAIIEIYNEHNLEIMIVPDEYPDDAGVKISDDFLRFKLSYPHAKWADIAVSHHGTHTFLYNRFVYRNGCEDEFVLDQDDELRYCTWLKNPVIREGSRMSIELRKRKKKLVKEYTLPKTNYLDKQLGGYVVARGLSGHWSPKLRG